MRLSILAWHWFADERLDDARMYLLANLKDGLEIAYLHEMPIKSCFLEVRFSMPDFHGN
jgi:hypothetical protein